MKRIPIYLPEELYEALRLEAFQARTSINKLVVAAILARRPMASAAPKRRKKGGK